MAVTGSLANQPLNGCQERVQIIAVDAVPGAEDAED
jgi:hypothetical protein